MIKNDDPLVASVPWRHVVLERIGPADASVGMFSLPIPRHAPRSLRIDHTPSGQLPVGWWRRDEVPRRVLTYLLADAGVPPELRLTDRPAAQAPGNTWSVELRHTLERLDVPKHDLDVDKLRGVPVDECVAVESEVVLTFSGKALRLQVCSSGPDGDGVHCWQDVQIDYLWSNGVGQGLRVGGIIYNGDTFLRADVYLVLFANGVVDLTAHFVNTVLHIEGLDYWGYPMIRLASDAMVPLEAVVPAEGFRFAAGDVAINVADCAPQLSGDHPGRLIDGGGAVLWRPFDRICCAHDPDSADCRWAPGMARTTRMQLSLAEAQPVIARYRAPSWWYALCDEVWDGGYLPVRGGISTVGEQTADFVRSHMQRGRFDAGAAGRGDDGDTGIGLLQNFYLTGRPELLEDALVYCYYWADLAVDHRDFTVHQRQGDWRWKTCAYCKFRDVLMGYLETGDPYLLDVADMCAETYWRWFRTNWPRRSIGRDAYSVSAWALMWRYFDTEQSRLRCDEFMRMFRAVLDTHGTIGGQMGGGPHPGHHSSIYMTGVAMTCVLDVCDAARQMEKPAELSRYAELAAKMSGHFLRTDVEMFPSAYGRPTWRPKDLLDWTSLACRIFAQLARLRAPDDPLTRAGLDRCLLWTQHNIGYWISRKRVGMQMIHPHCYAALMLGVRWRDGVLTIDPIEPPDRWPDRQTVATPAGDLTICIERVASATIRLQFDAASSFPIEVTHRGQVVRSTSLGAVTLNGLSSADDRPALR